MEEIEHRDRQYLNTVIQQKKEDMFYHIAEDNDKRRMCGFPTLYTFIDVCDRLGLRYNAEITDYRQAINYVTDCAVTFASVAIYV